MSIESLRSLAESLRGNHQMQLLQLDNNENEPEERRELVKQLDELLERNRRFWPVNVNPNSLDEDQLAMFIDRLEEQQLAPADQLSSYPSSVGPLRAGSPAAQLHDLFRPRVPVTTNSLNRCSIMDAFVANSNDRFNNSPDPTLTGSLPGSRFRVSQVNAQPSEHEFESSTSSSAIGFSQTNQNLHHQGRKEEIGPFCSDQSGSNGSELFGRATAIPMNSHAKTRRSMVHSCSLGSWDSRMSSSNERVSRSGRFSVSPVPDHEIVSFLDELFQSKSRAFYS